MGDNLPIVGSENEEEVVNDVATSHFSGRILDDSIDGFLAKGMLYAIAKVSKTLRESM